MAVTASGSPGAAAGPGRAARTMVPPGLASPARASAAPAGAGPKRASRDTSTNTGPRCGAAASRNASSTPAPTFAVSCSVQARLVIGRSRPGWSNSCRLPEPQRASGARPPRITTGEPLKPRRGDGADPVGHPGSRGQHGQPRLPGQPGGGLRGEHGGLLVPHVQQPHRRVRVHRRVVEREHVAAGQGEHGQHAVSLGCRHGQRAPVLASLVLASAGLARALLAGAVLAGPVLAFPGPGGLIPAAVGHAAMLPASSLREQRPTRDCGGRDRCRARGGGAGPAPAVRSVHVHVHGASALRRSRRRRPWRRGRPGC